MISYNPKDWQRFIFSFHRSDTFRKLLPLMIVIAVYSGLIAFMFHLNIFPEASHIKNLSVLHTLLGFAISLLLVFRTNTAYDRWWEGRRLWGALVNNSRNLCIKLNSMLEDKQDQNRVFFRQIVPRFALELKNHLQSIETRFTLDEKPHPEIPNFDHNSHVPVQVTMLIMDRVQLLYKSGKITGEQLIVLNAEVTSFMDICGACERIKNTPIPFSYSGFIKKFIFFYVVTLPFGYGFSLGYYLIPVVVLVLYVLASLEFIAEEIEDPFGNDSNDLPMQRMSETIQKSCIEILS